MTDEKRTMTIEQLDAEYKRVMLKHAEEGLTASRGGLRLENIFVQKALPSLSAYLMFRATERQEKTLTEQRDILTQQRDILTEQRDRLTEQRDILAEQRDRLTEQRDMLRSMNEQSKGMKRQTTWLLSFTVALFFAVIVQIILAAVLLSGS